MPNLGTRSKSGVTNSTPANGAPNGALTRDVGMNKLVTATVTFNASAASATAAAGTFAHFAFRDLIVIEGTEVNDGFFTIVTTDFSTYLTLDPPPKNGGPIACTIRTP